MAERRRRRYIVRIPTKDNTRNSSTNQRNPPTGKPIKPYKQPETLDEMTSTGVPKPPSNIYITSDRTSIAQWGYIEELSIYSHSIEIHTYISGNKAAHAYTLHLEGKEKLQGLANVPEHSELLKKALTEEIESKYGNNQGLIPTVEVVNSERELTSQEKQGLEHILFALKDLI